MSQPSSFSSLIALLTGAPTASAETGSSSAPTAPAETGSSSAPTALAETGSSSAPPTAPAESGASSASSKFDCDYLKTLFEKVFTSTMASKAFGYYFSLLEGSISLLDGSFGDSLETAFPKVLGYGVLSNKVKYNIECLDKEREMWVTMNDSVSKTHATYVDELLKLVAEYNTKYP